jgi:hypothetical protein
MAFERIRGLDAAEALFDTLDNDAALELGKLLAELGGLEHAAQVADVPEETGALRAGLAVQLQLARLRVRVGLLGLKGGRNNLFYGRPVEKGVRAQTVTVQRRRRVGGRLRTKRNRKQASDIVVTYSLHVKARAARPFIYPDRPELETSIDNRIDAFWQRILGAS